MSWLLFPKQIKLLMYGSLEIWVPFFLPNDLIRAFIMLNYQSVNLLVKRFHLPGNTTYLLVPTFLFSRLKSFLKKKWAKAFSLGNMFSFLYVCNKSIPNTSAIIPTCGLLLKLGNMQKPCSKKPYWNCFSHFIILCHVFIYLLCISFYFIRWF